MEKPSHLPRLYNQWVVELRLEIRLASLTCFITILYNFLFSKYLHPFPECHEMSNNSFLSEINTQNEKGCSINFSALLPFLPLYHFRKGEARRRSVPILLSNTVLTRGDRCPGGSVRLSSFSAHMRSHIFLREIKGMGGSCLIFFL